MAAPKGNKYAVGNKGGRATKYKLEYCEQIIEYFGIEPTREVPVITTFKNGTTRESTELKANELRFLSGFARKIKVCYDTLLEWTKKHREFSEAYTRAKALQKEHLITCGLLGLYNSKFAVFTAINITDMRDRQELVEVKPNQEELTKVEREQRERISAILTKELSEGKNKDAEQPTKVTQLPGKTIQLKHFNPKVG